MILYIFCETDCMIFWVFVFPVNDMHLLDSIETVPDSRANLQQQDIYKTLLSVLDVYPGGQ